MRLLRSSLNGSFELAPEFPRNVTPPRYAILSHTWLQGDLEVTYEDMRNKTAQAKPDSCAKIEFCSKQAAKDGIEFFWVDTCCIDKQNPKELQDAITLMFRWYRRAVTCYVHMADVTGKSANLVQTWDSEFRKSRWFTRGWTLQELLAPTSVEFFSRQGQRLGDKSSLHQSIHKTTGIPRAALQGEPLKNFSVPERFRWASGRNTTYPEDKAYSLLGIFGIHMPLIPHEPEESAMSRLREAIEKRSPGQTAPDTLLESLPISHSAAFDSAENQYESVCLKETRVELIREIDLWIESPDERCIFWLSGIAGTGKSTVAHTIARNHSQDSLGASFFFSKGGGDDSQANKLIPTLASQLAHRIPSIRAHICEAIRDDSGIVQKGIRDQWLELVVKPLSKVKDIDRRPAILLVVDALDECTNKKDIELILKLWSETDRLSELRLRILITSRPEIPIRYGFEEISESRRRGVDLHDVSQDTIDQDLRSFFEHELSAVRQQRNIEPPWPVEKAIADLIELSYGLFVWASTACRHISSHGPGAKDRLAKLINDKKFRAGQENLDSLYLSVLEAAVPKGDQDDDENAVIHQRLRAILGSIVLLNSRISLPALASLLNMELATIKDSLADLHAIIRIPKDDDQPLRLHHPTFRDFLLDKGRCRNLNFWIDEVAAQHTLAKNCIQLMSKQLRRNICGLETPQASLDDLDGNMTGLNFPSGLQYACLEWADHIRRAETQMRQEGALRDNDQTHRFLKKHFLHWVEALSILRKSSSMTTVMRTYLSLLKPGENAEQVPFMKHARMFIGENHPKAEKAPLQLYCAGLLFMPTWNLLRRHFWSKLHPCFEDAQIVRMDGPDEKSQYNYVNDIVFSPDGRKLASGSLDEWARVWDYSRLREESKYPGHGDKVSSVDISSDGKLLASGSDDSTIKIFAMDTTEALYTLTAHSKWIDSVVFSPDDQLLASGSMDETVRLWNMATGKEVDTLEPGLGGINSVSFSPDGTLLALGTANPVINLYSIEQRKFVHKLRGHEELVNSVQFSPDGQLMVSGSDDNTLRIWDLTTWEEKFVLEGHEDKVWATSFSQITPYMVASGSEDRTIKVWNPVNGNLLATLKGHTSGICAVAFSPDDRTLAAAAFNDEVRFWYAKKEEVGAVEPAGKLPDFTQDHLDDESGQAADTLENQHGHQSAVTSLAISSDGLYVATGSHHDTIKLWDTAGKEKAVLQGHSGGILDLVFSPDNQLLASASTDVTVCIWDIESGKLSHTLQGHTDAVKVVRFTSDGSLLASCSNDSTIRLWDPRAGELRSVLQGHGSAVNDIAISPNDELVASCSADAMVCLWNVKSATQVFDPINAHGQSINSIRFSADGKLLVTASADMTVKVFDVDGRACKSYKGHTGPVNCASFSPDMKTIVSRSDDLTIRLWNYDTGIEQQTLQVGVAIREVSFSDCGCYIETDRGCLNIANAPDPSRLELSEASSENAVQEKADIQSSDTHPVFATEEWVQRNGTNVLWLPEHFRVSRVAAWNEAVVLGHASGAVSFFPHLASRHIPLRI